MLYVRYRGGADEWKFYSVRDCRTVEDMAQGLVCRKDIERRGDHHNALDDAVYQAEYISAMWKALKNDR